MALLSGPTQAQVTNPISAFPITVDGQFTGGVSNGQILGEWSDVTPVAFISPGTNSGTLFRTDLSDSRANSLLYGAIASGTEETSKELYLMYDYLPRTNPNFAPGEFIADVTFPVDLPAQFGGGKQDITVQFRGGTSSFFDVFVEIPNGDKPIILPAVQLGMEGAIGFGPSALSSTNHLLVELEVPLRIPADFGAGGPLNPDGHGINPDTGLYDPNPVFWGSNIGKNAGDPPATAAIFTINPDGSVFIDPTVVPRAASNVPEPSALVFLAGGALSAIAMRRRSRRR